MKFEEHEGNFSCVKPLNPGDDYEIRPSVITVPVSPRGGRFCVNVLTNSDEELEGDEQFLLSFENLPSEFARVGENDTVCVTITDTGKSTSG